MSRSRAPELPLCTRAREATGLTQSQFSVMYRIPIGTIRHWEQRMREPDEAAKVYLTMILAKPQMVARLVRIIFPD